jgi:hypothetical protein
MLFSCLILSLPLLRFDYSLKLLLCGFYTELVSESQELLLMNAAEVVYGILSVHVDFGYLL